MITVNAYAKINWNLNIIGKFSDGYHSLDMLMQKINIFDRITIEESESISCNILGAKHIPDENNLILKAGKSLSSYLTKPRGAKIGLEKNIPIGAGLGGGSADAAEVLMQLNKLWSLNLSVPELSKIALKIGADVPYFIHGGLCRVSGRGECVQKLDLEKTYDIIIIKPDEALSTKEVFAQVSLFELRLNKNSMEKVYPALLSGNLEEYKKHATNDLQKIAERLRPKISNAINDLKESGAVHALMTGSGSAVFGVYQNTNIACKAYLHMKNHYEEIHLAKTILD